jgi:hypothetical protein
MCGVRETESQLSDCQRENSKQVYFKIILIQNKVHDYTLCLCTFELNHEITLEKNYIMLFVRAIWYGDNVELSGSTFFSVVMTSSDISTFFLSWPQLQP